MDDCLAQLAAWILPPTALPFSLPVALFAITGGGVVEAAKVWSGHCRSVPSVAELVWTPTFLKTTLIVTKVCNRLALRDKG